MFHVKDAEFNPTGRKGVYGGFQPWIDRAGRFRSLGDGQVNFKAIFSKLAQYDYPGWAVLEWECCLKHRSEEHTSELQSQSNLVCRLLLEKKKKKIFLANRVIYINPSDVAE